MKTQKVAEFFHLNTISFGLILIIAGCASPDPHVFQQYSGAVKTADGGLEQLFDQDIAWSKDEYVDNVLNGSTRLQDTAILDEQQRFSVHFPVSQHTTNQPTYYKLQEVRTTLLGLTQATEKYLTVLNTLAGADLINPATFDAMAKDTDASMNAVVKDLNAQIPEGAVHIFSVGSAEVARLIIENRRRNALIHVLANSQPAIEDYCAKCNQLLVILDQSLLTDYRVKALFLDDEFAKIPKEKRLSDPQARAIVEQLLQLDADYLNLASTLKASHDVYTTLPKAHLDLLKSVQRKPTGLEEIKSLAEEANRIKTLYTTLSESKPAKKG